MLTFTAYSQQVLVPDDGLSKVRFTIKNFGFNTPGSFKGLKGSIVFNTANIGAAAFDVTIDAATVDTDNKKRDAHLRKEEYFHAEKFPVIRFKSTKVTASADGSYIATGILTIKGVNKNISFPFKASALSVGSLFQGTFEINRRDFGVGGGSAVLGDNLKLSLSVYAK